MKLDDADKMIFKWILGMLILGLFFIVGFLINNYNEKTEREELINGLRNMPSIAAYQEQLRFKYMAEEYGLDLDLDFGFDDK